MIIHFLYIILCNILYPTMHCNIIVIFIILITTYIIFMLLHLYVFNFNDTVFFMLIIFFFFFNKKLQYSGLFQSKEIYNFQTCVIISKLLMIPSFSIGFSIDSIEPIYFLHNIVIIYLNNKCLLYGNGCDHKRKRKLTAF